MDQVEVFINQFFTDFDGEGSFFQAQAGPEASKDSFVVLDVPGNGIRRMASLSGGLFDGFALHQHLIADEAFMG